MSGDTPRERDKNGTNVTPIEANRPHVTGNAQCRKCATAWVAVIAADANLWLLECPGCGRMHGHIVGAFPESPYQAKVWSEEMWRHWYHGELPGQNVAVLNESPHETDGSAESAGSQSTESADILTVDHSRWITSSRRSAVEPTDSTTCDQRTGDATGGEVGGDEYVDDCGGPRW